MLTYPKSTLCVLRMLMHLNSGHVTLLPGEFHPPEIFPQSDLGRGRTHVGLCPKFLVLLAPATKLPAMKYLLCYTNHFAAVCQGHLEKVVD